MIKLSEPQYNFAQAIDECVEGITGNAKLRNELASSKNELIGLEAQYLGAASTGELYAIQSVNTDKDGDPIVIGTLKKSELIKIYKQYFVPDQKPARKIYDALLNSAKEKCPFCCGIGTPRNLDHFLPKSYFPQFSILTINLVPACRDCNMDGKADDFSIKAEDQIIQPYADKEIFFKDQWIFATYHSDNNTEPGEFEYYTSPPGNWSKVDKQRVKKHFEDFDLAKRYATKAAEPLGTILQQIQRMKLNSIDIQDILIQPGVSNAPFANHWIKGMYQALSKHYSIILGS